MANAPKAKAQRLTVSYADLLADGTVVIKDILAAQDDLAKDPGLLQDSLAFAAATGLVIGTGGLAAFPTMAVDGLKILEDIKADAQLQKDCAQLITDLGKLVSDFGK